MSASNYAIGAYVERHRRRLNLPAVALAVVEGDKIVHMHGFGKVHPGDGAPTPQTPFFIGSLTKSITALAVMQLVEAGKVELDVPLQRYLPWFQVADPAASAAITVRHLLHQTGGLPTAAGEEPLADFDSSPGATARQAQALATCELAHPPGAAFAYSNMNYNLLGLVVEAAGGMPYADYVQGHIFVPLAMRHTYTAKTAAAQNGLATGHQLWFWFPRGAPNLPIPVGSLPSGQIISCAEDMAHYLIALLNGGRYGAAQILSSAGCDELQRGVAEFNQWGMAFGKYGMGWFADTLGQTPIAWHTGNVPDFSAYMALLPAQQRGVVLLANAGHHMMVPVCGELGTGLAALLAGEQPASSPLTMIRFVPWAMRALLLIPLLQVVEVWTTMRVLRRWRLDPARRPHGARKWGLHFLLPLILNLAVAANLIYVRGKRRGYLRLFLTDYYWIAQVCGSFALIWSFLRSGLVVRALAAPQHAEQGEETKV